MIVFTPSLFATINLFFGAARSYVGGFLIPTRKHMNYFPATCLGMKFAHYGHHINNYYKFSRRCMAGNVIRCVRKFQESI